VVGAELEVAGVAAFGAAAVATLDARAGAGHTLLAVAASMAATAAIGGVGHHVFDHVVRTNAGARASDALLAGGGVAGVTACAAILRILRAILAGAGAMAAGKLLSVFASYAATAAILRIVHQVFVRANAVAFGFVVLSALGTLVRKIGGTIERV